jgi:hypothetical protein
MLWSDKENKITREKTVISSLCMGQNVRQYRSLKFHYTISRTGAAICQNLTLGQLPTIALKVVPFSASWKSCSVRVFSTAHNSASITSVVSKWQSSIGEQKKVTGAKPGE